MQSIATIDTFADESYVAQFVRYRRYLPFINYNHNYVEWADVKAVDHFFSKLARANHKKVKVLHIGDSHIQADFFTGYIRENIQRIFGYGGRGFIFPYAAAGTHSTYDYRTWAFGHWAGARNIKNPEYRDIGITGAMAYTHDENASFKFGFKAGIIQPEFTHLKIYCKKNVQSFDLKIKLNGIDDTVFVKTNVSPELPYVMVELPAIADTFQVFMAQTDSLQNFFECYGLMLESCHDKGVLYNSVGINGAGFQHVLGQTLMESQLKELAPDLVYIDLGANDFYGFTFKTEELTRNLESLIALVKKASPKTTIIVSCSQDIYKRKRNISTTANFSLLTGSTAQANGCAWYNWYKVAGGRYSMLKWRNYQLAKKDRVHLTTEGYNIKGDLYLNAFLNSYLEYLRKRPDKLLAENRGIMVTNDSLFVTLENDYTDPENDPKKTKIIHKVKKGEKLSVIAKKYKVYAGDIMNWNGLERAALYRGQKLVIYIDKKEPEQKAKPETTGDVQLNITDDAKKNETKPPVKKETQRNKPGAKTQKYTVKNGDTLWQIAHKYGVTVAQIKQWNNMRSDKIWPGKVLIIKK